MARFIGQFVRRSGRRMMGITSVEDMVREDRGIEVI